MSTIMQSPFDPFTFDDDNDQGFAPSEPATAAILNQNSSGSYTSGTSRTTNTVTRNVKQQQQHLESVKEEGSIKLPPRLNVRLTLHEEVSSTAVIDPQGDGGSLSQLTIEGSVRAQVDSSNANENPPFCLQISGPMASLANITCHDHCVLYDLNAEEETSTLNTQAGGNIGTIRCKVDIPKSKIPICQLFDYSMNVRTQNMPMLVQAKVSMKEEICKISVQIRSNLSNEGGLSDFIIVVAIPMTLRGETLKVTRGGHNGVWDANKRIITWKIGNLPHGESCLVSAEADVSSAMADLIHENPFSLKLVEEKIQCPVLVRCVSEVDQVSDLSLSVRALSGAPATILQQQMSSYRLLHRVGKAGV